MEAEAVVEVAEKDEKQTRTPVRWPHGWPLALNRSAGRGKRRRYALCAFWRAHCALAAFKFCLKAGLGFRLLIFKL